MRNSAEKQQGFVLVVVAVVLVVLVGFVALGVDTGALYSARTAAQEAADAGALAGAFTFIVTPTAPQPVAHAKAAAMANTILGDPILVGDVTVSVDAPNKRVTVTVQKTQQTFFAKALGVGNALISVTAKAEAGSHATATANPKPFFLPNTVASSMDPCDACAAGEFLLDPATGDPTAYGLAAIGRQVLIKPQKPSLALGPSLFYLIDFTGGGGGSPEIQAFITGAEPVPPVACGTVLEVEKGDKTGPINEGLDLLVGDPADDLYAAGPPIHFLINGTTPSDTSKALVTVPIWDTCGSGFCGGHIPVVNGHQQIAVLGYALVFLEGMAGNPDPLMARIINFVGCGPGAGGGSPGPSGSSVYGFPLRLVRVP